MLELSGKEIRSFKVSDDKMEVTVFTSDGGVHYYKTYAKIKTSDEEFIIKIAKINAAYYNRKSITNIYKSQHSLLIQINYNLTFHFKLYPKYEGQTTTSIDFRELDYGFKLRD